MKKQWLILAGTLFCLQAQFCFAQVSVNEAGEVIQFNLDNSTATTLAEPSPNLSPTLRDGLCSSSIRETKHILQPPHVNERDVMWEKRIWRELFVEEKMNQHFSNVEAPLIDIFLQAAKSGDLTVYHPINDNFTVIMENCDLANLGGGYDTIPFYNPDTYIDSFLVVYNELNPSDIISYRLKEVWYFDSKLSRLNVRILGIAPVAKRYDDIGNVVAITPLFWIYYPDARELLTRNKCFNPNNDADQLSWDDIFQARYFSSIITKQSNNQDRRIIDYMDGLNVLYEGDRIHNEIFNFEQDLWSR